MKKFLITALALMAGVSMAMAGMGISWANGGWMVAYGEDPTWDGEQVLGKGVAENNAVLWQLIFTTESAAATPDLTKPDYLGSDKEQLLDKREVASGGSSDWNIYLEQLGGETLYEDLSWNTPGNVYQRIWQGTPSTESDSYYFDSALSPVETAYAGGGAPPQESYFDPDGNGVAVNNVIPGEGPGPGPQPPTPGVPEPATMSLLGLGALAMVLRRKLSK